MKLLAFNLSCQSCRLYQRFWRSKGIYTSSVFGSTNTKEANIPEKCTNTLDWHCTATRNGIHFISDRTFSTSTRNPLKDKILKYYAFRENARLKREEFFQLFAPARFVDAAPKSWQPYLRLARVDRPIGTWLLYLPCTFGITLATPLGSFPSLYYLGLFGVGSFLMRGAGCVINDLWDRDLDKHVERTKGRPLASGQITPRQAIGLLAMQLTLSLGILLSLNTTCILIGVASMIPVILYPLAKRVTNFPQAVLGLTFNIGAIMGFAAINGAICWPTVLTLYLGCFLWTMYYDTIYAFQDVKDDAIVGIKSTAMLFWSERPDKDKVGMTYSERLQEGLKHDGRIRFALSSLYVGAIASWIAAAATQNLAFPAYIVLMLQFSKFADTRDIHPSDAQGCWDKFVENKRFGLAVLAGLVLGVYMGHPS